MADQPARFEIVANPWYQYFVSGCWGGSFLTMAGAVPELLDSRHAPGTGRLGITAGLAYAMVLGLVGLARMQAAGLPPAPLPDDGRGRVRLQDPGDGTAGFLDELARSSALPLAGMLALVTGALFLEVPHDGPAVGALLSAFGLACLGAFWWWIRDPYLAAHKAGAGRFAFTAWPIRPGEPVQVHYSRRLHPSCELVRGEATLERVWLGRWHRQHRHVQVLQAIPLGDGGMTRKRRGVDADWTIELPDAADEPPGSQGHVAWRLRVTFEIKGLPDDRSELYLAT